MGVALDIDETLADTVIPFVEGLIREFGHPASDPDLSARELIAKYQLAQHIPGFESGEPLRWIEEARTRPDLHLQAPVIEGAVAGVLALHEFVGVKCYATARHGTLDHITREWLADHGFPVKGIPIISKPGHISDAEANGYKVSRVQDLYPDVTCMVENSGSVVREFSADYRGTLFFYGASAHSAVRSDDVNVVVCPSWRDVAREVGQRIDQLRSVCPTDRGQGERGVFRRDQPLQP